MADKEGSSSKALTRLPPKADENGSTSLSRTWLRLQFCVIDRFPPLRANGYSKIRSHHRSTWPARLCTTRERPARCYVIEGCRDLNCETKLARVAATTSTSRAPRDDLGLRPGRAHHQATICILFHSPASARAIQAQPPPRLPPDLQRDSFAALQTQYLRLRLSRRLHETSGRGKTYVVEQFPALQEIDLTLSYWWSRLEERVQAQFDDATRALLAGAHITIRYIERLEDWQETWRNL
ncbi:hypothetical protein CC86DRAFT_376543 [Ophiobolus disseminans]|uniref:Uncharacterized protein n=1 Tax=Ophiobolus disseminans TaxID=1469910 RepID=A0A6A7AL13_9PLEO|nr:hypothetical protein CC86DRAFT_376543 [Ophiobolus disseminans]